MNGDTFTYSLHTASTGVRERAVEYLHRLYANVSDLPDAAERGWWLDNIDAVWPALACCTIGEALCPEAATHVAGMAVEGSRLAGRVPMERHSVGRTAVLLGFTCGVIEVS